MLRTIFVGDSWTQYAYSAYLYFMDNSGSFVQEYKYLLGFNPGQSTNRFIATVVTWTSPSNFVSGSVSGVFTVE